MIHRLAFALLLDKYQDSGADIYSDNVMDHILETLHADISHRRQVLT